MSATAVLPSGTAVTVSPSAHSDLFWAMQGGGGGNGALFTTMTFRTHPATSRGIFSLTFSSSWAPQVITRWASRMAATYTSRWANVHLDALGNGQIAVRILGVVNAGAEQIAAADLIHAVGVSPTAATYRQLSAMDTVRYLGGGSTSARQGFAAGSDILRTVTTTAAEQVVGAVAARSRAGGGGSAILDPLSGVLSRRGTADSAFPWRDHAASVQWYVGVGSASAYASAFAWINQAHQQVRSSSSSGGYVNYLETGQPAARYYGPNLTRLASVRALYDPQRRIYSGLRV